MKKANFVLICTWRRMRWLQGSYFSTGAPCCVDALSHRRTPLEHAIYKQKGLAVVKELFAFGADISSNSEYIITQAIFSKDIEVFWYMINRIDTKVLTKYFYESELPEMGFHNISRTYCVAYEYFLKRMNTIWKHEIWSLIYKDHEYMVEKIRNFILFRNNEYYIQNCIDEMKNMRLYSVGDLLIPDLLKISIYDSTRLEDLRRRYYFEIMTTFPIYGRNVIEHLEEFIARGNILNDLENLTLTSEKPLLIFSLSSRILWFGFRINPVLGCWVVGGLWGERSHDYNSGKKLYYFLRVVPFWLNFGYCILIGFLLPGMMFLFWLTLSSPSPALLCLS